MWLKKLWNWFKSDPEERMSTVEVRTYIFGRCFPEASKEELLDLAEKIGALGPNCPQEDLVQLMDWWTEKMRTRRTERPNQD